MMGEEYVLAYAVKISSLELSPSVRNLDLDAKQEAVDGGRSRLHKSMCLEMLASSSKLHDSPSPCQSPFSIEFFSQ